MANEELVLAYQAGNKEALEELINNNKGIVNKIVNKFYIEGLNSIDREDLEQEGYIGLITAAGKYDYNNPKRAQFITYAVYWIYQKINNFIRHRNTNDEVSLNTHTGEDGDRELLDCIEGVDYSYENIEDKLYNNQLRQELEDVMNKHSTLKERQILKLIYRWDNSKIMTYEEIGSLFNVTGTMIHNHEKTALKKIRNSPWGTDKKIELFGIKQLNSIYSIPGTVEKISFAQRYLIEEVV